MKVTKKTARKITRNCLRRTSIPMKKTDTKYKAPMWVFIALVAAVVALIYYSEHSQPHALSIAQAIEQEMKADPSP